MSNSTKLNVTGMTCNHCVMRVNKALQAVDGVDRVEVSLERSEVTVQGSAGTDRLIEAVKGAGYQAELSH